MNNHFQLDDRSVLFELCSYIYFRNKSILNGLFLAFYRFLTRKYVSSCKIVQSDSQQYKTNQVLPAILLHPSSLRPDLNSISHSISGSFKSPFLEIKIYPIRKFSIFTFFSRIKFFWLYFLSSRSTIHTSVLLERSNLHSMKPLIRVINSLNLAVYHDTLLLAEQISLHHKISFIFCLKDMLASSNAFLQSFRFYFDSKIFTSQHAAYRHFNQFGQITFNEANIYSSVSDYYLCWGKMVSDFVGKTIEAKPVNAGPPFFPSFKAFLPDIITVIHDNANNIKRNIDMDFYAKQMASVNSSLSICTSLHPSESPNAIILDLKERQMGYNVIASHSSLAAYLMIYDFTSIYLHRDSMFLKHCDPVKGNNLFYLLSNQDKAMIVKDLFGYDELLSLDSQPLPPSDYFSLMNSLTLNPPLEYI